MPQVKIRIERGVETAGDGQEIQESKKQDLKKTAVVSIFAQQSLNYAKQMMNFNMSHIGEWTGDYIKQSEINAKLENLGKITSIGTAIATSVATENPIPIILELANQAVSLGMDMYEDYRQQLQATHAREFMLARSGNSSTNNSRGTEN